MRHHTPTLVFVGSVELPSGNVRVVVAEPRTAPPAPGGEWLIHDCDGVAVGPTWPTRAEALREMGRLSLRGVSLPLTLHRLDGPATGDRLG